MKCTKCQTQIESGLLYCPNCGESIQLVPEYNVLEEELLFKIVEDKDVASDIFATGVYSETEKEDDTSSKADESANIKEITFSHKQKRLYLIILISLVICVLGIFFAYKFTYMNTYDYVIEKAKQSESESRFTNAIEYYNKAITFDPDSFDAIFGLGRTYYNIKDYKLCINYMLVALESQPENTDLYSYLLKSYEAVNDIDSIKKLADNAPNKDIMLMISNYIVFPPTFSEEGGNLDSDFTLYISSIDENTIYYSLDDKDPIKSGKLYTRGIHLKEGINRVNAVCLSSDGQYSDVISATYNITYSYTGPDMPEPSMIPGTYYEQIRMYVKVPDGYRCYYTWDGTDPSEASLKTTSEIVAPYGTNILSIVFIDNHGMKSKVYKGEFTCWFNQ